MKRIYLTQLKCKEKCKVRSGKWARPCVVIAKSIQTNLALVIPFTSKPEHSKPKTILRYRKDRNTSWVNLPPKLVDIGQVGTTYMIKKHKMWIHKDDFNQIFNSLSKPMQVFSISAVFKDLFNNWNNACLHGGKNTEINIVLNSISNFLPNIERYSKQLDIMFQDKRYKYDC